MSKNYKYYSGAAVLSDFRDQRDELLNAALAVIPEDSPALRFRRRQMTPEERERQEDELLAKEVMWRADKDTQELRPYSMREGVWRDILTTGGLYAPAEAGSLGVWKGIEMVVSKVAPKAAQATPWGRSFATANRFLLPLTGSMVTYMGGQKAVEETEWGQEAVEAMERARLKSPIRAKAAEWGAAALGMATPLTRTSSEVANPLSGMLSHYWKTSAKDRAKVAGVTGAIGGGFEAGLAAIDPERDMSLRDIMTTAAMFGAGGALRRPTMDRAKALQQAAITPENLMQKKALLKSTIDDMPEGWREEYQRIKSVQAGETSGTAPGGVLPDAPAVGTLSPYQVAKDLRDTDLPTKLPISDPATRTAMRLTREGTIDSEEVFQNFVKVYNDKGAKEAFKTLDAQALERLATQAEYQDLFKAAKPHELEVPASVLLREQQINDSVNLVRQSMRLVDDQIDQMNKALKEVPEESAAAARLSPVRSKYVEARQQLAEIEVNMLAAARAGKSSELAAHLKAAIDQAPDETIKNNLRQAFQTTLDDQLRLEREAYIAAAKKGVELPDNVWKQADDRLKAQQSGVGMSETLPSTVRDELALFLKQEQVDKAAREAYVGYREFSTGSLGGRIAAGASEAVTGRTPVPVSPVSRGIASLPADVPMRASAAVKPRRTSAVARAPESAPFEPLAPGERSLREISEELRQVDEMLAHPSLSSLAAEDLKIKRAGLVVDEMIARQLEGEAMSAATGAKRRSTVRATPTAEVIEKARATIPDANLATELPPDVPIKRTSAPKKATTATVDETDWTRPTEYLIQVEKSPGVWETVGKRNSRASAITASRKRFYDSGMKQEVAIVNAESPNIDANRRLVSTDFGKNKPVASKETPAKVVRVIPKAGDTKVFKQSEWKALPIVSEPTGQRGMIREFEGELYEWVEGGKRVKAVKVVRVIPKAETPTSSTEGQYKTVKSGKKWHNSYDDSTIEKTFDGYKLTMKSALTGDIVEEFSTWPQLQRFMTKYGGKFDVDNPPTARTSAVRKSKAELAEEAAEEAAKLAEEKARKVLPLTEVTEGLIWRSADLDRTIQFINKERDGWQVTYKKQIGGLESRDFKTKKELIDWIEKNFKTKVKFPTKRK